MRRDKINLKKTTMQRLNILFLTILFITSCQSGDTEKLVTIENKYSISIPSFLITTNALNEEASLQYLNARKEFYVIVLDEPKSEMYKALVDNDLTDTYSNDLEGYSDLILDNYEQSISISHMSNIVDTFINNMPARLLTINGQVEGVDIFYSLAFIQGKERYYQIMVWTSSSKESEYKDKMNKILYSFKEL